jgi:hypothetical protein
MDVYKPLRVVLFSYELFRLLFLAFSLAFFSSLQTVAEGGVFPYLAYLSSNALFPLICFFLCLRPEQYRNYLPLYMAGKSIAVVLFYVWAVFSFPQEMGFIGRENYIERMILLGSAFFFSLGDALSVFGTWVLNKKLHSYSSVPQADSQEAEVDGGL